jgi:hypothetical protein
LGKTQLRRSTSEKQPQQNNDRDRHTHQPQQNSSSHCRVLQTSIEWKTRRRAFSSCCRTGFPPRGARFMASEFRRATVRFETASNRSCRRLRVPSGLTFRIGVGCLAAGRHPLFVPGRSARKRHVRLHDQPVAGMTDVQEFLRGLEFVHGLPVAGVRHRGPRLRRRLRVALLQ